MYDKLQVKGEIEMKIEWNTGNNKFVLFVPWTTSESSETIPPPSDSFNLELEADVTIETVVSLRKRRHKKRGRVCYSMRSQWMYVCGWLVWNSLQEGPCGVDRFMCCQAVCLVNNGIRYSSHINKASSQVGTMVTSNFKISFFGM
jgi:hypothetical protein